MEEEKDAPFIDRKYGGSITFIRGNNKDTLHLRSKAKA